MRSRIIRVLAIAAAGVLLATLTSLSTAAPASAGGVQCKTSYSLRIGPSAYWRGVHTKGTVTCPHREDVLMHLEILRRATPFTSYKRIALGRGFHCIKARQCHTELGASVAGPYNGGRYCVRLVWQTGGPLSPKYSRTMCRNAS